MAKKKGSKGAIARITGPRNQGTPYQSVKNAEGREDYPTGIRMQEAKSLEGQKPYPQLKKIQSQQEIKLGAVKPKDLTWALNTLKSSTGLVHPSQTVKATQVEKGASASKALKKENPAVNPPSPTKKPPTPGR